MQYTSPIYLKRLHILPSVIIASLFVQISFTIENSIKMLIENFIKISDFGALELIIKCVFVEIYSYSSNCALVENMVLICGNTLQHVCRSPYRLYRPYHCDFQQATIPSSPSLYRAPNFDILSDFNRRSRRFERIASYQKVLSIIQVFHLLLLMTFLVKKIGCVKNLILKRCT